MAFSYKGYSESDAVKEKRKQLEDSSTYKASDSVNNAKAALDTHNANKVADWNGGNYGEALGNAINNYNNRGKFTYDLNGDALYQQYKDQYILGGKLAMQDTMGQASAMTGGYGNSYAATAGNQAYQSYLTQLNNVVPELYQMAYDKYNQEGEDLLNQANLYNTMYNQEYGEYRDKVSDWNTEASRLSDAYYNEANMDYSMFSDNRNYLQDAYNNERSFDYGKYSDDYDRALAKYELNHSSSSSGSSANYTLSNYQKVEEQAAALAGNSDSLYEYLRTQLANGFISQDSMDYLYNKYVGSTYSTTKTKTLTKAGTSAEGYAGVDWKQWK